jgi:hypothetical protein
MSRDSLTELPESLTKSPNSERRHHPVTPPSPSFLDRLWSSVRPGGLSTVKNHANGVKRRLTRSRKTLKKPKNEPRRRMISAPRPVTVTDWTDWYDVGQMTKDAPHDNALPPQRMYFMRSPVTTADQCGYRPCDDRHAPRGCSSRNIWLLSGRL